MYEVQISDSLYEQAIKAASANRVSVEAFVEEALQKRLLDEPDNEFENRFTPKVLAHLDRIAADLDAGNGRFTGQEVDEFLDANKTEWLANHPS